MQQPQYADSRFVKIDYPYCTEHSQVWSNSRYIIELLGILYSVHYTVSYIPVPKRGEFINFVKNKSGDNLLYAFCRAYRSICRLPHNCNMLTAKSA